MGYNVDKEWDHYKDWLMEKVEVPKSRYSDLMDRLHETEFIAYLARDDDRIEDGKYLRGDYCSEGRLPIYLFDYKPCSVLEVLVGLSIRIDNEWIGDPGEENPGDIFWEMLVNLGLHYFDNRHFSEGEVDEILEIWLEREFKQDGTGSIFPLKNPLQDQRDLDIWKQMQAYLNENY